MNLVQRVVFTYDISNDFFHQSGQFSTDGELRAGIAPFNCKEPRNLVVERKINIIDTDAKCEKSEDSAYQELFGGQTKDSSIKSEITTDKLNFTVINKLLYKADISKILKQRYKTTFDLNEQVSNENIPIKSFRVLENSRTGMVVNGRSTHYVLRTLVCEQATDNDIFVDKNLNQLYPIKGGVPSVLTALLAKTTEDIQRG